MNRLMLNLFVLFPFRTVGIVIQLVPVRGVAYCLTCVFQFAGSIGILLILLTSLFVKLGLFFRWMIFDIVNLFVRFLWIILDILAGQSEVLGLFLGSWFLLVLVKVLRNLRGLHAQQKQYQVSTYIIAFIRSRIKLSNGWHFKKNCLSSNVGQQQPQKGGLYLLFIIAMNQEQFLNCPSKKHINDHFRDQLLQLELSPKNNDDQTELMAILNTYLSYPDDHLANQHRLANKLGLLDVEAETRNQILKSEGMDGQMKNRLKQTKVFKMNNNSCHCCGFFVQPNDIGVCSAAPAEIKNLGIANRVFFQSFKYLAILLAVMVVVYSAFAFGTNISVANNTNYNSGSLDYLSISLGSKSRYAAGTTNSDGQNFFKISSWLGFVMLILWAFILGFIRKQIAMIEHKAFRKLGISDFSVVIENIPTDFTKEQIQQQFNEYLKTKKQEDLDKQITIKELTVVSYNEGKPFYLDEREFADEELSRLLKDYDRYKEQIADYVVEYRKYGSFRTPKSERTYTYGKYQETQIRKRQKYAEIVGKLRKKLKQKMEATRTVCFVTFLTHEQRNFVIDNNRNTLFYKIKRNLAFWKDSDYFKVKRGNTVYQDITVELPPEPQDINWGNLGLTDCQKFLRLCFTIFVSLIMVGISLVIVYALSTVQRTNSNQRFISILISLAISVSNLLIIKVIQFMTLLERGYSMNNYQISIAIKSVIVQLINSIVVPITVNYYLKDTNLFRPSGLVEDIFILAIATSFVPPLIKLIDPYNILLILRFKYYSDEERRLYLDQTDLNQISEKMQFEIGLEYIYLIHNFIFICFFVSLQPIIPCFGLIGYFLMYWLEKYSIFSRCQRPVPGPDNITSKLYQLIFFGAVAFALGNLTWSWFLPDQSFRSGLVPNLFSLGLSLIIFIFPYEKVVAKDVIRQDKNYYEKRVYFPSEYDRLNPVTSRQAVEEYRNFLQKKRSDIEGGNAELENQIARGFDNLTHNNMYKKHYMNRLSHNSEDMVIQQIFYNERYIIDPQELCSMILPKKNPTFKNMMSEGVKRGAQDNFSPNALKYTESNTYFDNYPDLSNKNPYSNVSNDHFDEDLKNVYRSNFRINGMDFDSKLFPEGNKKNSSR